MRADQPSFLVAGIGSSASGDVALLERVALAHGGDVLDHAGDDVWVLFADAVAAVDAGRAIIGRDVTIAIHTVTSHPVTGHPDAGGAESERRGIDVALRILDATNPGQALLSAAARAAARVPPAAVVDLGLHLLPEQIEPVRLFGLRSDRDVDAGRPPRAPRVRLGELPEPATSLVGRDEEVAEVLAMLGRTRLVTLTGVGGIGKTRLAIEVGRLAAEQARDGAWLVRLDTCRSAADVSATVLGAVGVEQQAATRRGVDSIVDGLRHRHAVVVLDNCEHVLEPVVELVVGLLASCPAVRILATSREPLDVSGEHVHRVPPLGASDDGPAVDLFCQRAWAAGASVDPMSERPPIGAICRRLDGIPLAIELAAARCRSIRPADLLGGLDDMLAVLGTAGRDAPRRHHTLAAALQWSYDLLSVQEQLVLARAAVFAGTFALDAATAVCAGGRVPVGEVAAVVDHLVARSLVVVADGAPDSRYRLLEPVRQFAREQLSAAARRAARRRHTAWFVDVMSDLGERWRAGDDAASEWIRRGERAIRAGSVDDGLLLAAAMHQRTFGGELAATAEFVEASTAAAAASADLHRQVWVFGYTRDGDRAVGAAERLGSVMLLAYARSTVMRRLVDAGLADSDEGRSVIEAYWEDAQGSHCPVMINHAGQAIADARIRDGAFVDGLLLLRAPLRDWYLSGDVRAWDVLQSIATGLVKAGDAVGAARVTGAIGDRRLHFSTAGRPADTVAAIEATIGVVDARRHARAGARADLGQLVAEAEERIEALARRPAALRAGRDVLTARQREVADLVASGLTNKQIARALGVSRLTVETHVRNTLERLGATSRAQIAAWAATSART